MKYCRVRVKFENNIPQRFPFSVPLNLCLMRCNVNIVIPIICMKYQNAEVRI